MRRLAIDGRFNYNADFSGFNFERKLATLDQLLDLLLRQRGHEQALFDVRGWDSDPEAPAIPHPEYSGDRCWIWQRDTLISLWLGNRTHTATHWDQSQNLACVVAGRRRFTLFPPEQLKNLYVGPLEFTLAGQPISLVDIDAPDLETYPRFKEAMKTARRAELGPGDALYIPALWWHDVLSLEDFGVADQFLVARFRAAAADPAQRALSRGHHDEGPAAERDGRVAEHVRPLYLWR